jgi:hypothetical protein
VSTLPPKSGQEPKDDLGEEIESLLFGAPLPPLRGQTDTTPRLFASEAEIEAEAKAEAEERERPPLRPFRNKCTGDVVMRRRGGKNFERVYPPVFVPKLRPWFTPHVEEVPDVPPPPRPPLPPYHVLQATLKEAEARGWPVLFFVSDALPRAPYYVQELTSQR